MDTSSVDKHANCIISTEVSQAREVTIKTGKGGQASRLPSKNLKIMIHRTIILPVVLYGRETWSLTLREERRLRVFKNRVLRRVFGPKCYEVTGEGRKLHNEELNDLYSAPNIVWVIKSSKIKWAGHVACMGERRGL